MLKEALFPEEGAATALYTQPDYPYIHKELARPGVNLTLLWTEYCRRCENDGTTPYMYTQFCEKYRQWARITKATMRIQHKPGCTVVTDGRLSQYISGIMMAASRLEGTTRIELTDPKEVPFLNMTRLWLESLGVQLEISSDYRHIAVHGPVTFKAFDRFVPSDWEAVAFPLAARPFQS